MKILHLIPNYIPGRFASGPNNVTHDLNKWLVKKGVDVTVYTTNTDGWNVIMDVPVKKEVNVDGVRVIYFATSFPRPWYYSSGLRKMLNDHIKDFDVVHITSAFLAISALGAYYAKKYSIPYLISVYGTFMKIPLSHRSFLKKIYISFIEKRNIKNAAVIHFASQKEKDESLESGLPIKNNVIIFSGVDPAVFNNIPKVGTFRKKYNIPSSNKIILFLGRFHWIKGFDTLIPAFAEVVKKIQSVTLVLAGYTAGYEGEITNMIEKYKLEKSILIPGPLFNEEKNAALNESDMFVLSSYSEAASIASIEALFFGLPVVITKGCGFSFEIEEHGAGIAVEKKKDEMRDALLSFLENESYAYKVGENGRYFARNELTFEKIAEKFFELYKKVAEEHNKVI